MISILMPLYNGVEFLNSSVNSVIKQTFSNWELLIGLNGLSEKEANDITKIIKSYNDDRIKVFNFKIRSKTKTLNSLLHCAKHNIICLLDVDDVWVPEKLSKQLPYIKKYDVVGTNFKYIGDSFGCPDLFLGKLEPLMFSYQNPIVNSSAMLKRRDVYWDENWEGADDYNLWINLLNIFKTFYNVPEILTFHRIHKNSYFNNKNTKLIKLTKEKLPKLKKWDLIRFRFAIQNKKWDL